MWVVGGSMEKCVGVQGKVRVDVEKCGDKCFGVWREVRRDVGKGVGRDVKRGVGV